MRVLILFLLLTIGSNTAARDLAIDEAVQLASSHSFELKKAKAQSQAYLENVNAQKANRYPTLGLDAKALYNSNTAQLNLDLPGFTLNREIGSNDIYQADLKLSVPLYTGGKISSGINLAQATYEMNQSLASATSNRIEYLAKSEYLKLYQADLMIQSAQASLERIKVISRDINSAFSAGAADSLNLIEVNYNLNEAELGLKQAQTNRRSQEIMLLSMMGLPTDEKLNLTDKIIEPDIANVTFSGLSENKSELSAITHSIEMNRQLKSQYQSAYYPTVALFGGYSYGKPNIDMFSGDFNDNFTVGATLNWSFNLGGKTSSQTRMAQYQIETAQNEYDRLNDELTTQAKTALENLKLANENYIIKSASYKLASDNYRLAQTKHRAGGISSNRLLEIENDLGRSEAAMLSSKVAYHIILAQYNYIVGNEK